MYIWSCGGFCCKIDPGKPFASPIIKNSYIYNNSIATLYKRRVKYAVRSWQTKKSNCFVQSLVLFYSLTELEKNCIYQKKKKKNK